MWHKMFNAASRDAIFAFSFVSMSDRASVLVKQMKNRRRISNFWPQTDTNGRIDAI